VAIAGATGYAGQEMLKLLAAHPLARVTAAMSSAPGGPARALPALARLWDGMIEPFSSDRLTEVADIVCLGLPDDAAAQVAPRLLERGVRVIDLSGAFRLHDPEARRRWYPSTNLLPGSAEPVYGLTERNRTAVAAAQLVANPGCYPTAAVLALGPLADSGLLTGDVVIDAKSGISGTGKKPTERTHFSECHGNVAAYGVLGHRHQPEIEQELQIPVAFVPHLVPLDRGILETIYARLQPNTTMQQVTAVLEAAYVDAPFVRLCGDSLPEIKHVAYTNFCDIGWRVDGSSGRLVLVVAIDNLLKGAAGQALQNFNVMLGLDERAGLLRQDQPSADE
jgi:N-acetyl-gamma-glutamyl-phosphate reductase